VPAVHVIANKTHSRVGRPHPDFRVGPSVVGIFASSKNYRRRARSRQSEFRGTFGGELAIGARLVHESCPQLPVWLFCRQSFESHGVIEILYQDL
jgi:hypothetical protein